MSKPLAIFDIECYVNYFLICFHSLATGRRKHFELYEGHPLDVEGVMRILRRHTIVGFNSNNYDVPMLKLSLRMGVTNKLLKQMSDDIVQRNMKPWECDRKYNLPTIAWLDSIDLIEPMPSVGVGLKLYGARLHSRRLQDLPIEPGAVITPEQRTELIEYCYNDLETTIDCYRHIEPQIALRIAMTEQYGIDLRSKSDAQIAEAVIRKEVERIKGDKISRPEFSSDFSFHYQPPAFLSFKTDTMLQVFSRIKAESFGLDRKGDIAMPDYFKTSKIKIGNSVYKLGIGGLHSTESAEAHLTDDDYIIKDADVGAFYPQLILVCGLYPEHLGPEFLDIYKIIRQRRMAAKKAKDKVVDMAYKIILNGAFGKLGSQWSTLYSPNLMIQVTLTGQLVLLMLIEELELSGIQIISANTDGIVAKIRRSDVDLYHRIVADWEKRTGFEMEFADYRALYSRDVNNYLAVKADGGGVKQKGAYAFVGSKGSPAEKNPSTYVCIDAVIAYLTKGTPLMETIEWCPDIRRFLAVRKVTGGALYDETYLGKTVRWYYAKGSDKHISYVTNGNKVAKSDGCKPMMTLDGGLPNDINYEWYFNEAVGMLGELGVL